jgi:hypothetical protein
LPISHFMQIHMRIGGVIHSGACKSMASYRWVSIYVDGLLGFV